MLFRSVSVLMVVFGKHVAAAVSQPGSKSGPVSWLYFSDPPPQEQLELLGEQGSASC